MNSKNNQNSDNKAAKCPLMTFDDSDDESEVNNIDYINQSIIQEFDPLTHDDNEIPWEYHWHDFITFTRQYGFIEFFSGIDNDESDTDDDNELVLAPARPSTPIESGDSDSDSDDVTIETDSTYSEDDNEYEIEYHLPMWTPVHPGKIILNHQDNNDELMQNYCRFILMLYHGYKITTARQLCNNENCYEIFNV
ncbi:hypothetical protein DERP_011398 [Dermatophagoides pteronyssinus]|uniref:Uncharacterized protein n=1 Tax=Dermatophagoides pteronyssinus TaxID=6956 RepID=A0ABQ8J5C0_DERPT|nr:hypothetical protein DERP_011398 [Dermatophagoides pteronyssinus]